MVDSDVEHAAGVEEIAGARIGGRANANPIHRRLRAWSGGIYDVGAPSRSERHHDVEVDGFRKTLQGVQARPSDQLSRTHRSGTQDDA